MKILGVVANNRKHAFEVRTRRRTLVFPYTNADPAPSSTDRIAEVFVDPELGRDGFTYRLASGVEGSVHIDAVLEYNEDPSFMAELTLYRHDSKPSAVSVRLDDEVRRALNTLEASGLSRPEAIRKAILDAAAALRRTGTLQAEAAVLDADEQDRQEILEVASLMDSLRAPGDA